MPSVVKASAEGPPWALARWTGSPGTPKGWPMQEAGVGRTPEGEGGPNGPTGFLTLPGEEWATPGIGPRNLNMTDTNRIADNSISGASLQRQGESRPAGMGARPFRSSTREILATKAKTVKTKGSGCLAAKTRLMLAHGT